MSSRLSTDTHNLPNYNISIRNVKSLKDLNILYCFIRLWKGKFWLIALTRFLCMKNMLVPLGCPFLNHIIHYWGHCSCLWGEESMSWYMWSCAFFPQILFSYDPSRIFLIPGDTTGPTTRNITSCKEAWPRCQGKPRPSRVSVFVPRGKNISSN